MRFDVAKQFSKTPFGRYTSDGPFSAEVFREDYLMPIFNKNHNEVVEIDFTGISLSLGSSFLEEAFGGLVRNGMSKEELLRRLKVESKFPIYEERIKAIIEKAEA